MTGIFLQTSLYAHVTVRQSLFSAAQSVLKGNISEACGSFCAMQDRTSVLFLLRKSPVGVSILRKLCRNNLVVCWLIEWSVQVTPLSWCGTNGFHRTTGCCMLLSGNEITLPKPNSKHVSNLEHRNIMRTLDWATLQTIHQRIIVKKPLLSHQWSHCIKFKLSQHYFAAWRNPWRVYASTFAATDGPVGAAGVSRMNVHARMWFYSCCEGAREVASTPIQIQPRAM